MWLVMSATCITLHLQVLFSKKSERSASTPSSNRPTVTLGTDSSRLMFVDDLQPALTRRLTEGCNHCNGEQEGTGSS